MAATQFLARNRFVLGALAASAALHAAVIGGWPGGMHGPTDLESASYEVSLIGDDSGANVSLAPGSAPSPPPRRAKRRASPPKADEALARLPDVVEVPAVVAAAVPAEPDTPRPRAAEDPEPERVALAAPATPVPALEPAPFPTRALPAKLSISYSLTSVFADGQAEYTWSREGDRYEISGSAQAVGFFTLFLEGQISQESRGTVTAEGLKPERFREYKPGFPEEGLSFDWDNRRMSFSRNSETHSGALTDNTVDWLSMIFQLAHMPPNAEQVSLRVFTQRRLYEFTLKSLGVEELDLPIGKVRALHLRHEGKNANEAVDVWLGLDQHNLPVKLRYPVARNRFMVEQVATGITAR